MEKQNKISKVSQKKMLKRNSLFNAAYELFLTKGIHDTAIDDIVKKAGVGKGTFYLYFKNKYDIVDRLILNKSMKIIKEAVEYTSNRIENDNLEFSDSVIVFIDCIIERLRNNTKLLKFIYKNLSLGVYRRATMDDENSEKIIRITKYFISNMVGDDINEDEAEKILFMIVELTGSVCYSSIILNEPDSIDNMKPILFKTIRKVLKN
ncbi:TetR/AcrR family transcriptional regulator [Clostridium sp. MB40-C1]|uniref:TetR/AcrR family transcriptional regulator n=1 Tax=Clostridium sp. MB40-C1 TaxID=3070996 RepID=UPI0027DF2D21|nr:TetR/AcrR family transcriptional regulator [Clostridium sp. MB40-C1]WMJ79626.1 TetR/AcrR family transcriptional regulator [Clostridium sp. MB40-C1]